MAELEVTAQGYEYEAGLWFVSPENGFIDHIFRPIDEPSTDAITQEGYLNDFETKNLAWVDLSRRAILTVLHDTQTEGFEPHGFGLRDYPQEIVRGQRQFKNHRLVTDHTEQGLQFMTPQEILASGTVPVYTAKWLAKLAQGNMYPSMFEDVQALIR